MRRFHPVRIKSVLRVAVRNSPPLDSLEIVGELGVVVRDVRLQHTSQNRDFWRRVHSRAVDEVRSAVHIGFLYQILSGRESVFTRAAVEFMVAGDQQNRVKLSSTFCEEVSVLIVVAESAHITGQH